MKETTEIVSWNVNGLRSAYAKGFLSWLADHQPDILCLQEIRSTEDVLPPDLLTIKGYHTFWHSARKPGYSGIAIFSKKKPLSVELGLGVDEFDDEGRYMIAHFSKFSVINCYVPNGRSDHSRVESKVRFLKLMLEKGLMLRSSGKNVIVCGDWNVAHTSIDLFDPKGNKRKTGFLPEERACMDSFVENDFLDVHRFFYPDKTGEYTWWSYRKDSKRNNVGWRFDYFFTQRDFLRTIVASTIYRDAYQSDHCPLGITLSMEV